MVLAAVALLGCLVSPARIDTSEYKFKATKVAYFMHTYWPNVKGFYPGIQIATDREHPPLTGNWIFVDEKQNTLVFGSRDDSAKDMATLMAEFDVAPQRVQLVLTLERPEWGLKNHATIETSNNESVIFGSQNFGASLTVRPRINRDGTVGVFVEIQDLTSNDRLSCVARLDPRGNGIMEIAGGIAVLVKETAPVKGEGVLSQTTGDAWKPFIIRVSAHVLDTQRKN